MKFSAESSVTINLILTRTYTCTCAMLIYRNVKGTYKELVKNSSVGHINEASYEYFHFKRI